MGIVSSILTIISAAFNFALIFARDFFYVLGNLVLPKYPVGKVIAPDHPGYGGHWPEYRAPQTGDSRCPCPGLNAMANHGILPRDGKGIKFTDLSAPINATYNFSLTFGQAVGLVAALVLKKNYSTDTFDLAELNLHNGIEHDASITRLDTALEPDQSVINPPYIQELFVSATGKNATGDTLLTMGDLANVTAKRRAECKATNPEYSLDLFHKLFGSANTSMLLTIFGGRVDDLTPILSEERIPAGWEPRVRERYGQTVTRLNMIGIIMELAVAKAERTGGASRVPHNADKAA